MKTILLLLCLVSLVAVARPALEMPDATTLAMINAGRDEQYLLKADQVRVLHPVDFPEVTLIGYLSSSNSLLLGSAVVNNQLMSPNKACGLALQAKGFESADESQKIALALQWLEQAQLGFGESLVRSKPANFGSKWVKWSDLETQVNLNGALRIVAWIESPRVVASVRQYYKTVYWFSKEGFLLRSKVLDTFELELPD